MSSDTPGKNVADAVARAGAPTPPRKRFYKAVELEKRAALWVVLLDGRVLRTPGKRELALPNQALGEAIAGEWDAQDKEIDPISMPLTRLASSALDGIAEREGDVRADIVKYSGSDLLCYRAEHPKELAARQAEHWDPVLVWAGVALNANFVCADGVMPVTQPVGALAAVAAALAGRDAWALAALHVMTTLTGSALLAIAHASGELGLDDTWRAAHVDEDFQIEKWGEDAEAAARRTLRRQEMSAASRFLGLIDLGASA